MEPTPETLDRLARRILLAAEADLRRALDTPRLDRALVAALYLRIRETLLLYSNPGQEAVDDIALTIYLTATAWQSDASPTIDLLSSLHTSIDTTLRFPQPAFKECP